MNQGHDEKRVEAGGEPFPAHDQATVLPLEPGNRPLGLVARHALFGWAAAYPCGFPHALGTLGPQTTHAEAMTEVCGIIPCIRREDLEPLARSAPFARMDGKRIP
jgi:hypothetical protein